MFRQLSTILLTLAFAAPAAAATLHVAAAASDQAPLDLLVQRYEAKTHDSVLVSYGASGHFFGQLLAGAPYDVFFSADKRYPAKLQERGLVRAARQYAAGQLVLWTPADSTLDLGRGLAVLTDPQVRHVAIANPALAPYGEAAMEALRASGLEHTVKSKLVYGEDIAQAAQFVQTGNAEVGLLALAVAKAPKFAAGKTALIPNVLHRPITADVVVLESTTLPVEAWRFVAYCTGPDAQPVWRRFGLSE
ncbi:MAG TPA: molybdate ABC transporter substrate-binding protein [Oscillatoriaceae cyanobacterium]